LLENNGEWLLEAKQLVNDNPEILKSLPIKGEVPDNLISSVSKNHQVSLVNNPANKEYYANDKYIQAVKPMSLMGMPVLINNNLRGVLYFENQNTAHAFTPKVFSFFKLLLGQLGVSIENALYYKMLKDLNIDYERFVPKKFLKLLGKEDLIDVKLGDHTQKNLIVGYLSINNYNDLTKDMTSEENLLYINTFLSYVAPAINKVNVFIDKYLGDGVMALFSEGSDTALSACIEILSSIVHKDIDPVSNKKKTISVGIGLHYGALILGTVGDPKRLNVTVISDTVNTSARIKELTKYFGFNLLISEDTFVNLKNPQNFCIRRVSESSIRGKEKKLSLYEVYDADSDEVKNLKIKTKKLFDESVELYIANKLEQSHKLFSQVLKINPHDSVSRLHIEIIEEMTRNAAQ